MIAEGDYINKEFNTYTMICIFYHHLITVGTFSSLLWHYNSIYFVYSLSATDVEVYKIIADRDYINVKNSNICDRV